MALVRIFFRGLLTILPISLCVYLIYIFFVWAEAFTLGLVKQIFGKVPFELEYVTGMGILLGVIVIFLVGLLMSTPLMQWLFRLIESPFRNVPLLKSIYTAIKDLMDFFSPKSDKKANQVVSVKFPKLDVELVGFLTRDNLNHLPQGIAKQSRVAVYFPMSYQIGGYTVFVPKENVTKLDISVEDAMKLSLTAWMKSD